jgi:DNA-binding NarL/FixJ family response regulator
MLRSFQGSLEEVVRREQPTLSLCDSCSDPMATSSFLHLFAWALTMIARYEDAIAILGKAEQQIRATRLSFAQTHINASRLGAVIGLRRFARAAQLLDQLQQLAQKDGDAYQRANSNGMSARLKLALGDYEGAAADVRHWSSTPTSALRSELAALRALALAQTAKLDEAEAVAEAAISLSEDVQAQTTAYAAKTVVRLRSHDASADAAVAQLVTILDSRRNWDSLITAYRAHPPLLTVVASHDDTDTPALHAAIEAAHDKTLATSVGVATRKRKTTTTLSRREYEVFELVSQGLTNKEIATRLFISEATAKVHVRHILEKLGARSRTEAVAKYHDA